MMLHGTFSGAPIAARFGVVASPSPPTHLQSFLSAAVKWGRASNAPAVTQSLCNDAAAPPAVMMTTMCEHVDEPGFFH